MAKEKEKKEESKLIEKLKKRIQVLSKLSQKLFLDRLKQDYSKFEMRRWDTSLYNKNRDYYYKKREILKELGVDLSAFPEDYLDFLKTIK